MPEMDKTKVVSVLNRLLEAELSGVVRYTHHSSHPLHISGVRLRPNSHHLVAARASQPVTCCFMHNRSVALDEFARQMIQTEELHAAEVAVYGFEPAKQ